MVDRSAILLGAALVLAPWAWAGCDAGLSPTREDDPAVPDDAVSTGVRDDGDAPNPGSPSPTPRDAPVEWGPSGEPIAPLDTIVIWMNDVEIRFPYSDGHYNEAERKLVVTGDRLTTADAESFTAAAATLLAGTYPCGFEHVLAYNARDEYENAILWSTRREGGQCVLVLESVEAVGGRVIGHFSGTLVDESQNQATLRGAFNVVRIPAPTTR